MDSVGAKLWKAGIIQAQLTGKREVILTRWAKPVEIVDVKKVAENIKEQIKDAIDVMPTNVVSPQQREALEAIGVKFVETNNKGEIKEGENAGKTWTAVYGKKKAKGSKTAKARLSLRGYNRTSDSLDVTGLEKRIDIIKTMKATPIEIGSTSKEDVRNAYNSLTKATNRKDGKTIEFYRGVFGKMWRGEDSMFAKIAPSLDKIFEDSVYGFSSADNLGSTVRPDGTIHKEHRNIDSYDYYIGKAKVDSKDYYVRFTIQNEHKGASGLHDVMCTDVQIYENLNDDASTSTMHGGRLVTNEVSDAKLMDLFGFANNPEENLPETPKLSITSATDFTNDISEKGLQGVLGKEAVDKVGMIKPTLEHPQVVIEIPSKAKDGNTERASSLLFVKTFLDENGKKVYYFKSVTVRKDGLEVGVSSHYDRAKRIKEALKEGKLLYRLTVAHRPNITLLTFL